jgi:hypothetical protein
VQRNGVSNVDNLKSTAAEKAVIKGGMEFIARTINKSQIVQMDVTLNARIKEASSADSEYLVTNNAVRMPTVFLAHKQKATPVIQIPKLTLTVALKIQSEIKLLDINDYSKFQI